MPATSGSLGSDPFTSALADRFDPPTWEPADRPVLEPHQTPPAGEWSMWLLEGGRGCGKTEACSRYFAAYMRRHPGSRGRIIAPTFGDAAESCIQGPSGLLSVDPEIRWVPSNPGGAKVIWPNGSEALVLGTPTPRDVDRLRAGGNRHIDWWEEMAANPQLQAAWDQAAFGLRLGIHPHSIGSTTPRSTAAYRSIRAETDTVFTRATMFDNPHNPKVFVDRMLKRYEGTRIGQQELYGLLLTQAEPDAVIDPAVLAEAQVREIEVNNQVDMVVIACDVARYGNDETVISERVGNRIRIVEHYVGNKPPTTSTGTHQGDTVATAKRVAHYASRHPRPAVRIVIDDTGVGGGVTDNLRTWGWQVTAFNGGEKAHHADQFPNRRSELWFQGAAMLEDLDLDPDEQLGVDLTEPRYSHDLKMRRVVEKKIETKQRLGRSPDRADSVLLTLVPPAASGSPVVVELDGRDDLAGQDAPGIYGDLYDDPL